MKRVIYFLIPLVFISCTMNKESKTDSDNLADTEVDVVEMFAFIVDVHLSDKSSIDLQHIHFLTGDEAIEVAKEAGDVDIFIDENGEEVYSLPNDYYLFMDDENTYSYKLAADVEFSFIDYDAANFMEDLKVEKGIESFAKSAFFSDHSKSYSPFRIELKDGVVQAIYEVYIP